MHTLTITDHSGDFRDKQTLLFNTEAGARGYAALKGDFCGMKEYALDGRAINPADWEITNAEQPCGFVTVTRQGRVTRTWEAA